MRHFRTLIMLVLLSLLAPSSVEATECPEGYKCLTNAEAAQVLKAAEHHNCMVEEAEAGNVEIIWEENQIIVTEDGQVFGKDVIKGTMTWCDFELEVLGSTDYLVLKKKTPPDIGFALRIKLGVMLVPMRLTTDVPVREMIDPTLLFEPFHLYQFHPQIHFGLSQFGLTVGMDLTKNLDVHVGAGMNYKDAKVSPVLGLSLSFN